MKTRLYLAILVVSLVSVCFVGCKKNEPVEQQPAEQVSNLDSEAAAMPEADVNAADAAEAAEELNVAESNIPEVNTPPVDPNAPVATINGIVITEAQLAEKIAPRLKSMAGQVPAQYMAQMKQQLRGRAIDAMISEQLLDAKVKDANITVSEDEVKAEVAKQMKQQGMSEEDFVKVLGMYGINMDQLKSQLRRGIGYQKLMEGQFADKVKVSDEDANKYYQENVNEFKTPEQVQASHILIGTKSVDPNADPNKVKAEAKAKAQEVLAKVKAGGDFAALAKEYSTCPSAPKGGDLGLFGRGQMVKPFEDAAFALEPNQVSDIVETEFGYHIIKVTQHVDANTVSFQEAKPRIIEMLSNQKKNEMAKDYVASLKSSAKIEYAPGNEPAAPKAIVPPVAPAPADVNQNVGKPADVNAAK